MFFSISFPEHLEKKIESYCKRNEISEADMLCLAIENLLAAEKADSPKAGHHGAVENDAESN